jgi:hypothetical protein
MILQRPPLIPAVKSAVKRVWMLMANAATFLAIDPANTYHPEAHYMRGPGPKWRAKHAQPDRP